MGNSVFDVLIKKLNEHKSSVSEVLADGGCKDFDHYKTCSAQTFFVLLVAFLACFFIAICSTVSVESLTTIPFFPS